MSDFIYESRTYNLTLQITNDGSVEEGDQWVAVHRSTKKQLTPEQLAKKFASDGGGGDEVKTTRKGAILVPPAWRRVKKTKPTKKRTSTSSKKSKTALVLVSPERIHSEHVCLVVLLLHHPVKSNPRKRSLLLREEPGHGFHHWISVVRTRRDS